MGQTAEVQSVFVAQADLVLEPKLGEEKGERQFARPYNKRDQSNRYTMILSG